MNQYKKLAVVYINDIHLEFRTTNKTNKESEPIDNFTLKFPEFKPNTYYVLIIAGDLGTNRHVGIMKRFFNQVCWQFNKVIYVLGNHDYYYGDILTTVDKFKTSFKSFENLHILDNESIVIEGQRFVGSTLWSPVSTVPFIQFEIADFSYIKYEDYQRTLNINQMDYLYQKAEKYLISTIKKDDILITHFVPSFHLIASKYKESNLNTYYANNLLQKLIEIPKIIHFGHSHDRVNRVEFGCHFINHSSGYYGENPLVKKEIDLSQVIPL